MDERLMRGKEAWHPTSHIVCRHVCVFINSFFKVLERPSSTRRNLDVIDATGLGNVSPHMRVHSA